MMEPPNTDPWANTETSLGMGLGVPVAIGGEITPGSLLGAYRRAMFCQPRTDPEQIRLNRELYEPDVNSGDIPILPSKGDPYALLWWSPQVRYVIPADSVRLGRSTRRTIRTCGWTTTVDADFKSVIGACSGDREPRWITDELIAALSVLHATGWVRTVEVWDGSKLVGGLFGCALGGAFVMDSAFHVEPEAAKIAIADLARRTCPGGATLLDTQVRSEYTVRMGALAIPRHDYLERLNENNMAILDTNIGSALDLLPESP